jgi:hypothetical protein
MFNNNSSSCLVAAFVLLYPLSPLPSSVGNVLMSSVPGENQEVALHVCRLQYLPTLDYPLGLIILMRYIYELPFTPNEEHRPSSLVFSAWF